MGLDINKMKEYFDSEEGQKSLNDYVQKINNEQNIRDNQLKRFHQNVNLNNNLSEFVEKVCKKYDSDKYKDRWYKRGYEPQESLYWFLYSYFKEYGREAFDEEIMAIDNPFINSAYIIDDYMIGVMNGQGSYVKIYKISDIEYNLDEIKEREIEIRKLLNNNIHIQKRIYLKKFKETYNVSENDMVQIKIKNFNKINFSNHWQESNFFIKYKPDDYIEAQIKRLFHNPQTYEIGSLQILLYKNKKRTLDRLEINLDNISHIEKI